MAGNEVDFNHGIFDNVQGWLAGGGSVGDIVSQIPTKGLPADPLNIGESTGAAESLFPPATAVNQAFQKSRKLLIDAITTYGSKITLMGDAAQAMGQTYKAAADKDSLSANDVQKAIDTAGKKPSTVPPETF